MTGGTGATAEGEETQSRFDGSKMEAPPQDTSNVFRGNIIILVSVMRYRNSVGQIK